MKPRFSVSRRVLMVAAMVASPLSAVALHQSPVSAETVGAAATCTGTFDTKWTGAVSADWGTAGNWTAGVPTSSTTVCIDTSATNSPSVTAAANAKSVTATDQGFLEVDGHLTIAQASQLDFVTMTSNGQLTVGGVTTITNQLSLDGSTIDGTGSLVVQGTAYLDSPADGTANHLQVNVTAQGVDADNVAAVLWQRGPLDNSGHTLTVGADAAFQTDSTPATPALTTNGLSVFADGYVNLALVNINASVTTAGSFTLMGTISGSLTQTGGSVGVSGQDGPGTLTITGGYTQSGGSLDLNTDAGPAAGVNGTNYDRVNVGGTYAISGDSTASLNPPFQETANNGNTYNVVHAASRTGTYADVSGFDGTGLKPAASYTATDVVLTLQPAPGYVSGQVVADDNGDGDISDDGFEGVDGVRVYADLNNNNAYNVGEPTDLTVDGYYNLENVPAGTAHIRVVVPTGYNLTTPNPRDVTVISDDSVEDVNIGLFLPGVISGVVFNDDNSNHHRDAGETALSGVTVFLDTNGNNLLDNGEATQTSASDGTYAFTGLAATDSVTALAVWPEALYLTTYTETHNIASGSVWDHDDFGFNPTDPGPQYGGPVDPVSQGTGYWLVGANGSIYAYGDAQDLGQPQSNTLNSPIVSLTPSPQGNGYWAIGSDGGVFAYGDAGFYGSTGNIKLNQPVVNMAATPSGEGYWMVAKDGGVFAFGDAGFYGSAVGTTSKPIVGIKATPDGGGYWMVASDGGVFAYGDAPFYGSTGGIKLNSPIVGMAANAQGTGYLLVAADGGVFAYGDAQFLGAPTNLKLNGPIVSIKATADLSGYWLIAADGGVFAYGSAGFLGAPTNTVAGPIAQ